MCCWNSFRYYTLLWHAMLTERRRPYGFVSKVSVVLAVLRNNDIVGRYPGAASAHALVLVIVLLIPWDTRLAICEIGKNVRALLKNLFAGVFIVIIHRTFVILDLYTIVWKRSYASSNRRFNVMSWNVAMRMISWINMIISYKDILKWTFFSKSKFIRRPVRPVG